MFVVDTFCFNGEWVVPMRLEYLNDAVDAFVIVESRWTHSGIQKPDLFKDLHSDWFVPYAHKIHWIVVDEFPEMTHEWLARFQSQSWMLDNQAHWFREAYQRDVAGHYIADTFTGSPCIVHVSDADELPSVSLFHPQFKATLIDYKVPIYLEQEFFYYNFQWKKAYPWCRAFVVNGEALMKPGASLTEWRVCPSRPTYVLPKAGWHCSYFMTVEELQKKLESFAHRECNQKKWNSAEHIRECITYGFDLFDRENEELFYCDPTSNASLPPVFLTYTEALQERQR